MKKLKNGAWYDWITSLEVFICCLAAIHDDVIKWKYFQRYRPFVIVEFPAQRSVTRSFDVFFDLRIE